MPEPIYNLDSIVYGVKTIPALKYMIFNGYDYFDTGIVKEGYHYYFAKKDVGTLNNDTKDDLLTNGYGWGMVRTYGHLPDGKTVDMIHTWFDKGFTKYIEADNKTRLEPEDDIAHIAMGGFWRMPTVADYTMLTQHVSHGSDGKHMVFTNTEGDFMEFNLTSDDGFYWTSDLNPKGYTSAYKFVPENSNVETEDRISPLRVRGIVVLPEIEE